MELESSLGRFMITHLTLYLRILIVFSTIFLFVHRRENEVATLREWALSGDLVLFSGLWLEAPFPSPLPDGAGHFISICKFPIDKHCLAIC